MMHGFIPPARYFAYLNWKQVEALPDTENTVLLQPVAATEMTAADPAGTAVVSPPASTAC